MKTLRPVAAIAILVALLTTQPVHAPTESHREVRDAIARGDLPAARARLALIPRGSEVDSAAARDLLDAAVAPRPVRVRRLLAVAAAHATRPEGLTALIAALGHDLLLAIPTPEDPAAKGLDSDQPSPADLARAAQPLVLAWEARRKEDPEVRFARELLTRLQTRRSDTAPLLRILAGTAIPVPRPLAEPLQVLAYPDDGELNASLAPWIAGDPPAPAVLSVDIDVANGPFEIPALPAGSYVLEMRAADSGFRTLRRLLISSLDVGVQMAPDAAVALATLDGVPVAGVVCTLEPEPIQGVPTPTLVATTDADGLARIAYDDATWIRARLDARLARGADQHRATLSLSRPDEVAPPTRATAHLFVERPLYRAGEVLRGRVIVRRHGAADAEPVAPGEGLPPRSSPLPRRALALRTRLPGQPETTSFITTDADGIATFELPVPQGTGPGSIHVRVLLPLQRKGEFDDARFTDASSPGVITLCDARPARVRAFVRPPLFLSVDAPSTWRPGDAAPVIKVAARYPTGTPAAGLAGRAEATLGNVCDARQDFTFDANGEATVELALPELSLRPIRQSASVTIKVTAPDGQELSERCHVSILPLDELAPPPDQWNTDPLSLRLRKPTAFARDGDEVGILVRGRPNTTVLVTALRERIFEARAVTLDAMGHGNVSFAVRASWTPFVSFKAQDPRSSSEATTWRHRGPSVVAAGLGLDVRRRSERLELDLVAEQEVYRPGEEAVVALRVSDETGKPRAATVALAVVDETLFTLEEDRTPAPFASLRPRWLPVRCNLEATRPPGSPWLVLGALMKAGGVPRPESDAIGFGGGAGGSRGGRRGGGGASTGDAPLRRDFPSAAAWMPKISVGPDGAATVRFKLPDNLTRWRLTAVVVDEGRGAALATSHVRVALPVSVNPVLPRFLREGDRAEITLRVDRDGGPALAGRLTAGIEGDASATPLDVEGEVAPDASWTSSITVDADRAGSAILSAAFRTDEGAVDRIALPLPLLPRTTEDVYVVTDLLDTDLDLESIVPSGVTIAGRELEVLGSVDALLAEASEWLTAYPHGCAEQTASRLVPLLVASHARLSRVLGGADASPQLLAPQARRLEAGLARLRSLQTPDGGFAWWSGSTSDALTTGAVLRSLALAHESGIDPELYGIRTAQPLTVVTKAIRSLLSHPGDPAPAESLLIANLHGVRWSEEAARAAALAEIVAAALLIDPQEASTLEAARSLSEIPTLPSGLALRLGLALARGGDEQRARRLFDVVAARFSGPTPAARSPHYSESPASIFAAALDLSGEVAPDSPLRTVVMAGLLRRFSRGRLDHTFGTASAIVALSRDRARHPDQGGAGDGRFSLDTGDLKREVVISPRQRTAERITLPLGSSTVHLRRLAGSAPLVSLHTRTTEDGATAPPRAAPFEISRSLVRRTIGPDGTTVMAPAGDSVRQGDLLEIRLEIKGPPELTYLLAECPLPAGFELASDHPRFEAHDDRVAVGLSRLPANGRTVVKIPVIAGMRGRLVWPPANVFAMYEPELRGRTAGGEILVEGPMQDPAATSAVRFFGAADVRAAMARHAEAVIAGVREGSTSRLRMSTSWPTPDLRDWLTSSFVDAAGQAILEDADVGAAWVRSLGGSPETVFLGAPLEDLQRRLAAPRVLERLAPVLARGNLGTWAAASVATTEPGSSDRILLRLTALRSRQVVPGQDEVAQYAFVVRTLLGLGDPAGPKEDPLPFLQAVLEPDEWTMLLRSMDRDATHTTLRRPWVRNLRDAAIRAAFVRDGVATTHDAGERKGLLIATDTETLVQALRAMESADAATALHVIAHLLAQPDWPEQGAARSPSFLALTERLAELRADWWADAAPALLPWLSKSADVSSVLSAIRSALWQLSSSARHAWAEDSMLSLSTMPRPLETGALALGGLALQLLPRVQDDSKERPLDAVLLTLYLDGPQDWRKALLGHLSKESLAALPVSHLLAQLADPDGGDACVSEIGRRPLDVQRLAIDQAFTLNDESLIRNLARSLSPEALFGQRPERLITLSSALDMTQRRHREVRALIVQELLRGTDLDRLGSLVANTRHPTERATALRAFLLAGGRTLSWNDDDPGVADWRERVAASTGDPSALRSLRKDLFEGDPSDNVAIELWWVLSRHATLDDLVRLRARVRDAEPELVRDALTRVRASEVIEHWRSPWKGEAVLYNILAHAPDSLLRDLLPSAPEAFEREGGGAAAVLRHAPAAAVLAAILPRLPTSSRDVALRYLALFDAETTLHEQTAHALLGHADLDVRYRAAENHFLATGHPVTIRDADGSPLRIAATDPSSALTAALRRLRREGIATTRDDQDPDRSLLHALHLLALRP